MLRKSFDAQAQLYSDCRFNYITGAAQEKKKATQHLRNAVVKLARLLIYVDQNMSQSLSALLLESSDQQSAQTADLAGAKPDLFALNQRVGNRMDEQVNKMLMCC